MIANYNECIEQFGSKYKIGKMVAEKNLFKLEKGVYSDEQYVPEYRIIAHKYQKAIFTMDSAFYYHGLTDVIPDKYHLMTARGASRIRDERVVQMFENSDALELGAEYIKYNDYTILMYNKERMLLELIRNRSKLPFDYYKEILNNYRKITHQLDIPAMQDMLEKLPKSKMIRQVLELEVF